MTVSDFAEDAGLIPQRALSDEFSSFFTMAGFDAVFQMRADVLQRILLTNVEKTRPEPVAVMAPYNSPDVPREIDLQIAALVAAAPGGSLLRPIAVEARVLEPVIRTLSSELPPGADTDPPQPGHVAEIVWSASFRLVMEHRPVHESLPPPDGTGIAEGASVSAAPGVAVRPSAQDIPRPGWRLLNLGSGAVRTFARLRAASRPRRFIVWAELDILSGDVEVSSRDPMFLALLEAGYRTTLDDALQPLFAGAPIPITPLFSLPTPGVPPYPVGTAPPQPVSVQLAVTHISNHEVLALCVNAPLGPRRGDPNLVVPFLTTQNFACCYSLEIVRSIVWDRWPRLGLPSGFSIESPFEITDPNHLESSFKGRARIRLTLRPPQPTVSLVDSPSPLQDALQLVCQQEVQLLELKNENGDIVDPGELGTPEQSPLSWRIQLFDGAREQGSAADIFFRQAAGVILDPLYRPMIEPMRLRNIEGVTLSAKGLVFMRGDLH